LIFRIPNFHHPGNASSNISPYDYNEYGDNVASGDRKATIFGDVLSDDYPSVEPYSSEETYYYNYNPPKQNNARQKKISNTINPSLDPPVVRELPPRTPPVKNSSLPEESVSTPSNKLDGEKNEDDVAICTLDMFMCSDGSNCIENSFVCDGFQNCDDNSDEFNCTASKNGELW